MSLTYVKQSIIYFGTDVVVLVKKRVDNERNTRNTHFLALINKYVLKPNMSSDFGL